MLPSLKATVIHAASGRQAIAVTVASAAALLGLASSNDDYVSCDITKGDKDDSYKYTSPPALARRTPFPEGLDAAAVNVVGAPDYLTETLVRACPVSTEFNRTLFYRSHVTKKALFC